MKRNERSFLSKEKVNAARIDFESAELENEMKAEHEELLRKSQRLEERLEEMQKEMDRKRHVFEGREKDYRSQMGLKAQQASTRESEQLTIMEKMKQAHADEIRAARHELEAAKSTAKFASVPRSLVENQASVAKLVGDSPMRMSTLAGSPRSAHSNQLRGSTRRRTTPKGSVGELENMVAFAASLLDDSKDTVPFAL